MAQLRNLVDVKMTIQLPDRSSLEERYAEARALCRAALSESGFDALKGGLRGAPDAPEGWFRLLHGYPQDIGSVFALKALIAQVPPEAAAAGFPVERYAILQALLAATSRLPDFPLPNSVRRLFTVLCREVAGRAPCWRGHFHENLIRHENRIYGEDGERFRDLARLATLRRHPAGDYVFDFSPVLPRSWLLKAHPSALPGLLYKVLVECGGWGPTVAPHINSGRANQLFLRKEEFERSLARIARALAMRPDVKALATNSWLLSAATAGKSPNLAWFRTFFAGQGAYLIDMEPAASDAGFRVGSVQRRRLHDSACFFPRDTLALWPRRDVLAWAAAHPDLADPDDDPVEPPRKRRLFYRVKSPSPRPEARRNARFRLWNGIEMLNFRPARYIALTLLLPSFALTLLAILTIGWQAAAPAFLAALTAAWLFQYYFFQ